jgi:hypothetical protein
MSGKKSFDGRGVIAICAVVEREKRLSQGLIFAG